MKLLKYATLLRILYDEKSRNFIILLKKNQCKIAVQEKMRRTKYIYYEYKNRHSSKFRQKEIKDRPLKRFPCISITVTNFKTLFEPNA